VHPGFQKISVCGVNGSFMKKDVSWACNKRGSENSDHRDYKTDVFSAALGGHPKLSKKMHHDYKKNARQFRTDGR
jgi:hypothetical protein